MNDFACVETGVDAHLSAFVGHCIFVYIDVQTQAVHIIVIFKGQMSQQANVNPEMVRELNSCCV